jgi:hypothetical protein
MLLHCGTLFQVLSDRPVVDWHCRQSCNRFSYYRLAHYSQSLDEVRVSLLDLISVLFSAIGSQIHLQFPFFEGYVIKVKAPFICAPIPIAVQSYAVGTLTLKNKSLVSSAAVSETITRAPNVELYTKVDEFNTADEEEFWAVAGTADATSAAKRVESLMVVELVERFGERW